MMVTRACVNAVSPSSILGLGGTGVEGGAAEGEADAEGADPPTRVRTSLAEHPLTSSRRALCRGGKRGAVSSESGFWKWVGL